MALEFKIGRHQFLSIDGVPPVRQDQGEVIVRPGVNGLSFWNLGTRGTPFTVRTRVDYRSRAQAMTKRAEYAALTLAGPVTMVWGGYFLKADNNARVMVLEVLPLFVGELLVSSGGLNPPSLAYLECEWQLVLV